MSDDATQAKVRLTDGLGPNQPEREELKMPDKQLTAKEQAAMDAGVKFGMDMLKQVPKGDRLALEAHMTGVLIAFWGALWGTFGTEYARGFIECQLRGMEPDMPSERFTEPRVQ